MSGETVSGVDPLYALHKSWQVQLDSSHAALMQLHHRWEELSSTHHSLESFTSSLFAIERRVLLEQLHSLCRDKLAMKKQLSDLRRDRAREAHHHHSDHTTSLLSHSQSHPPTDNGGALLSPPSVSSSASPSTSLSSFPLSSLPTPSSSSSDLLLRSEVEDLRSQVGRLRQERQSLLSQLHQREAELEDAEHSIRRLSKERDRMAERLREMEERAVLQLEANAVLSEVVRRGVEKERRWMEERAEIEREMERMGTETIYRRGDGRMGALPYGTTGAGHRPLQSQGEALITRHSTHDSEDSDNDAFDSTSRTDSIEEP